MTRPRQFAAERGFALVVTLLLLALLVLAAFSLGSVSRLGGQVASSGAYRMQARQAALLALDAGLGELQRHAGDDTRITGMAGMTGLAASAGNSTRHWCGVWRSDGGFVAWLTSGAQAVAPALLSGVPAVELAGQASVGAAAANSEHVVAGKLPLTVPAPVSGQGTSLTLGHYAYWVADEGVKISAYAPASELAVAGVKPLLTGTSPGSAQGKLRAALDSYAGRLAGVTAYGQLSVLPSPSTALTPSVLQDNFHHVTLTARSLGPGEVVRAGMLNINTNSAIAWRSLLETYNSVPGVTPIPVSSLATRGNAIANGIAASAPGKASGGPFTSVAAFGSGALLAATLPAAVTPAQFMGAVGPMLAVRSDTFRIRGYGEAVNPADPTKVEAAAFCEAVVQRTTASAPNGLGRRFVVTHFRWLGADDI